MVTLLPTLGELVAVSGTSAAFTMVMVANVKYQFVSSTLCYIKQSAGATAAAAASTNTLVPPNTPVYLDGAHGARLTVIQHTAAGSATLTPTKE